MAIVDAFREDTLLAYATGVQPEIVVPLNGDSVLLGHPQSMVGSTNTQVVVSGTGTEVEGFKDVYVGQVILAYDRLDLGVLFNGIVVTFEAGVTSDATTMHGWLAEFSELYGVKLYPEDVEDTDLTADGEIVVKALPTSLNYTGGFAIDKYTPPIDIDVLSGELDIFSDPVTPSDFIYARQGSDVKMLPVNGERLTSGVDFTPFRTDVETIINTGLLYDSNRAILRRILRATFGLVLDEITNNAMGVSVTDVGDGTAKVFIRVAQASDYLVLQYRKAE